MSWNDKYDAERRQERYGRLFNRPLLAVKLHTDREQLDFEFEDGSVVSYLTYGDCCSFTWIEHLEQPIDLRGAVITGVDEPEMEESTNSDDGGCTPEKQCNYPTGDHSHECVACYRTVFHTDKGDIDVEYRNDSNGYYGGDLVLKGD